MVTALDFRVPSHVGGRYLNISHVRMRDGRVVLDDECDPCIAAWLPDAERSERPKFSPRQTFLALKFVYETNHQDIECFDIYDACKTETCDQCGNKGFGTCNIDLRKGGDVDCEDVQRWVSNLFSYTQQQQQQ